VLFRSIIGVSRHGKPHPHVHEMVAMDQLDVVLPRMDYVFVSLPSTPETVGLFNRQRLQTLKPGAGVVNVGRGSTFDYEALANLLASGYLSGAVIDVFDEEPLPHDSPLWVAPNFVVTPHVSADDGDSYVPITLELFFNNLKRYVAGEPLLNVVRPELGY
jgi:phosphoglycerate dehydrogenase-like enzyme